MMKKRVIITGILLVILTALLAGGCANSEAEEKAASSGSPQKSKETFTFQDVKGNAYEAELLKEVPKADYDYTRLTDENGFKYYTDSAGKQISTIGIDVSEYQKNVNWNQVKAAGIDFAIIRLGYRGYGQEGKLVEDAMFKQHIDGATKAGLDIGVYFFSQAISQEETVEEAEFVLSRIKNYQIKYPVVFDTEEITYDTARTEGLSRKTFTDNCIVFCDAVEKAGYQSMIYANMKWMAFTLELEKLTAYSKWYADYQDVPQCPYNFQIWQYTESGTVPGVEGNVDMNVAFSH